MFQYLQIQNRRERWLVGLADLLLAAAMLPARLMRRRRVGPPRRILLLRLERIGDLLMALGAIAAVVDAAGDAEIDLAVASWNEAVARCIPGVRRIEALDAAWLSRDGRGLGLQTLARRAQGWRARSYDLAINFEGDIRSHLLMAISGARRRIGFDMAGGGPLLTDAVAFDPRQHVAANAMRLVTRAFPEAAGPANRLRQGYGESRRSALRAKAEAGLHEAEAGLHMSRQSPRLSIPDDARHRAAALLEPDGARRPLVGLHASGGRAIKQWHPERLAEVANALRAARGATIVLTGAPDDRRLVDQVKGQIGGGVIDLCGRADLVTLAAVLQSLDLFITGDTGPMHLAAAVGTPLVALFGPSDPARWGPAPDGSSWRPASAEPPARGSSSWRSASAEPSARVAILRVDLPCSPCNRIRQPPERCVGHVPDCLDRIETADVTAAAIAVLDRARS